MSDNKNLTLAQMRALKILNDDFQQVDDSNVQNDIDALGDLYGDDGELLMLVEYSGGGWTRNINRYRLSEAGMVLRKQVFG